MRNFLPFARRELVHLEPAVPGRTSRAFTRITPMSTGGCIKAHLQDVIIYDTNLIPYYVDNTRPKIVKMRMGVYGRQFLTEEFYDVETYKDGQTPFASVWNWKKPYRLFPGQSMKVTIDWATLRGNPLVMNVVPAIMFLGRKVATDEPWMLYDSKQIEITRTELGYNNAPDALADIVLDCPKDSPMDIFSVTFDYFYSQYPFLNPNIYIEDGNRRPFWPGQRWARIIDAPSSPIILGDEWSLDPGEIITFEFETDNQVTGHPTELEVTVRGVLEVEVKNA